MSGRDLGLCVECLPSIIIIIMSTCSGHSNSATDVTAGFMFSSSADRAPCKKHPSFHLSLPVRRALPRSCAPCRTPAGKLPSDDGDRTVRLTHDTCTPVSDQFGPTQNARARSFYFLSSVELRAGSSAGLVGRYGR